VKVYSDPDLNQSFTEIKERIKDDESLLPELEKDVIRISFKEEAFELESPGLLDSSEGDFLVASGPFESLCLCLIQLEHYQFK